MKFLVTGDWHADWSTAGVRRYEDVENAAMRLVQIAVEKSVDCFLFLGDLSDPDVGAFQAASLAIRVARSFNGTSNNFWLVGNHDIVEDSYGTHVLLPVRAAGASVIDLPRAIKLRGRVIGGTSTEVWLAAFPYTSTARSYDPLEALAEMAETIPLGATVVVISHLMLEGIGPGSETKDMARGRDVFLPVEAIRAMFPGCVIYNGHYHQQQVFNGVYIPGSLVRLTQSEIGNVAGYLIGETS